MKGPSGTIAILTWLTVACMSASAEGVPPGTWVRSLEDLLYRFGEVESVHLRAAAHILFTQHPDGSPTGGNGAFEYWADGSRYRIRCVTDDALGLMDDVEMAYDGSLFQLLLLEESLLSVQRQDPENLPTAIPNPFFLPLRFLSRESDDCQACAMRLSDLSDSARWERALAQAKVLSQHSVTPDEPATVVDLGDVRIQNQDLVYRLTLSGARLHTLPQRLEMISNSGNSIVTVEYRDWQVVQGARMIFPKRIDMEVHDPETGEVSADFRIRIEEFEVNVPIDETIFTVDRDSVAKVWDSDDDRWIKGEIGAPWN